MGAAGNIIQGNYIGVTVNGTAPLGNANQGIALFNATTNTLIGGTAANAGNVISGNGNAGIRMRTAATTGTLIQGNRIGTNAAGTAPIPNALGIEIFASSSGNIIGGPAGSQNVISGNTTFGIIITGANNNTVSRAHIGLNAAGNAEIPNGQHGVQLVGGASGNVIGGVSGTGNVISGNGLNGVDVVGAGTTGNSIRGNHIGLDAAGGAVLSNGAFGVSIAQGATGTIIGNATGGNVISGNDQAGVRIVDGGTNNNLVQSNLIGLDVTGMLARPNLAEGVILDAAPVATGNRIGGVGLRNVISGNGGAGIRILNSMTGTLVVDNIIGRNATSTGSVPNGGGGVRIESSSGNTIGGTGANEGNTIAGNNGSDGVAVVGAATGNAILRNSIFSNAGLGIDLGDDGITANDAGDADPGPNALLNFPQTTAVLESGGTLTAYFRLDLLAGSYRVEFFKNPSGADGSGNGEGEVFASSSIVTHSGAGLLNFNHNFAGAVGDVVTSTTTFCSDGPACAVLAETSEFGNAQTAVPTAVELISFDAVPRNSAVDLSWRTGSELYNLGFHLYRALSPAGPFNRITDAVIPGLGSSPMGASYDYTDSGLANGVRYFYKLEDIETTGRTALHGPVSAMPEASGEGDERTRYGAPGEVSLRVLDRNAKGALLELVTGGFFAIEQPDGTVRLEISGFEDAGSEGAPAVPVKRTWLEVVAGRKVSVANVRALEVTSLPGLRPASAGTPEINASPEGTVRAGRRRARQPLVSAGLTPESAARVADTGFQGDVKKALLELAPLRWDGRRGQLLWARRLQVRLSFAGDEPSERALGGSRGRRHQERPSHGGRPVLARLTTSGPGLYRVSLADVPGASRSKRTTPRLRLSHRGETVPFHLERGFGYFVAAEHTVYELESGAVGRAMTVLAASPSGPSVTSYEKEVVLEENRYYQAGLLEAPSLWLWDVMISPSTKSYPFRLGSLLDREATLRVFLQGASDFDGPPDHRVRISVNGHVAGEAVWEGKAAKTFEASLAPGVLREGENEISFENTGGGSAYTMVFLDRFAVAYVRPAVAEGGVLEGRFGEPGVVAVSQGSLVVQTSPEIAWLRRAEGASFRAEAGRSYLAVSLESVLEAKVRRASASDLRNPRTRAGYLLVGPREFLSAAEPLLRHRRGQGLLAKSVAVEEVYDEFGYGIAGPEALKAFLEYAYHHWSLSPRYVVLFGDATYDQEDLLGTGVRDRVPALMLKTSYLWTASDPAYAAVNGEDPLPDLALGRLPAATLEEARVLVRKVLEYEESGQDLSGPAVLVADNPDAAGDFEADSDEIAAGLADRDVRKIYLRELGTAGTRRAILESLDSGASLLSYVGHGGIALWASENVLESKDVATLGAQGRQPIVMTLNCLNGYFHFPYFDSLGEAFVKAKDKGAIAAFSPSGLSLNAPAHVFHQALAAELVSGRHARLGDAVLAAQKTYADSGLFPELLAIYHLLGDPALQIR